MTWGTEVTHCWPFKNLAEIDRQHLRSTLNHIRSTRRGRRSVVLPGLGFGSIYCHGVFHAGRSRDHFHNFFLGFFLITSSFGHAFGHCPYPFLFTAMVWQQRQLRHFLKKGHLNCWATVSSSPEVTPASPMPISWADSIFQILASAIGSSAVMRVLWSMASFSPSVSGIS